MFISVEIRISICHIMMIIAEQSRKNLSGSGLA